MQNAPVYKTAADLSIEQWEHDGLVALIGPLSRGEKRLNMKYAADKCGTVFCIGGWVAVLHGIKSDDSVFSISSYVRSRSKSAGIERLYYPKGEWNDAKSGWFANAPQAARAIVNFLVTGDPQWDAVMSEA